MADDPPTLDTPAAPTAPAEGSPAEPAASDAPSTGSDLSPEDRVTLEARQRFERVAERHERQDAAGESEAPPAEGSAQAGDQPGEGDAAKPEESATAEPPEGFDEALAALLRDGTLSEQRLQQWFQDDPQEFIKAGQKAAKRQKDVDRRISGQSTPKADPAAPGTPGNDAALEAGQAVVPPKDFIEATKRAVDDVLKGLEGDELYGDLKEPLGVLSTHLAEQMGTYMAAELAKRDALLNQIRAEAEQQKEDARAARVESEIQTARAALKAKYPGITDDNQFQAVLDKYDLIVRGLDAEGPQYQSVGEVLTEAAKWVFSDANPANAADRIKQNLFKRSAQQQRGLPSTRATPASERKLTADEKARQIFDRIADKYEGATAA